MKHYLMEKMYGISYYLEIFISMILAVVIAFLSIRLAFDIFDMDLMLSEGEVFSFYLEKAMNLAVGVELIKMLCKHTPGTVVEVLLFAIARQVVVSHSAIVDTLVGVLCIVALFATRKYLFLPHDDVDKITLRGSQSVKLANRLAKIHIPAEETMLLRDVIAQKLQEEDHSVSVGACVEFDQFSLCIASMNQNKITRVEVLKQ